MGKNVAIEITDQEVRVLWFSGKAIPARRSSLTITGFDRMPIPPGVILQGQLLDSLRFSELLKELRLKRFPGGKVNAVIGLPWQQGFVRVCHFPRLPEERRYQAIRYLVEEEAPFPADDLAYDALVLGGQPGRSQEILIGALKKSVIENYAQSLENAGYQVEGADFTVSALTRALDFRRGKGVLYLHVENHFLHVVFFHENKPELARTLKCFFPPSPPRDCPRELEKILLSLAAQLPEFSLERILWSGEHTAWEIAENLLERLNQAAAIEEAFPEGDFPSLINLREVRRYSPVAYALVVKVYSGDAGLNVWPEQQEFRCKRKLASFGILPVASFLILGSLYTYVLFTEERGLREEIALLQPEGKRIESVWKQEEELADVWALLHKGQVGISLAKVEQINVPGLVLQEIEYKQGGAYLRGYARQADAVEQLLRHLSRIDWKNPTLNSYQLKEGDVIEFAITAGRSSPGNI